MDKSQIPPEMAQLIQGSIQRRQNGAQSQPPQATQPPTPPTQPAMAQQPQPAQSMPGQPMAAGNPEAMVILKAMSSRLDNLSKQGM